MEGQARLIQQVRIKARQIIARGIRRFLRVTPVEEQHIDWLHPGQPVEYHVESNTQWKVE